MYRVLCTFTAVPKMTLPCTYTFYRDSKINFTVYFLHFQESIYSIYYVVNILKICLIGYQKDTSICRCELLLVAV